MFPTRERRILSNDPELRRTRLSIRIEQEVTALQCAQ